MKYFDDAIKFYGAMVDGKNLAEAMGIGSAGYKLPGIGGIVKNDYVSITEDQYKEQESDRKRDEEYKKAKEEADKLSQAKTKSYLDLLKENIDKQKQLREETLKHITVLNDYASKYKSNYDVLKLVNEELTKQKEILQSLDNYAKANDKKPSFGSLTSRGYDKDALKQFDVNKSETDIQAWASKGFDSNANSFNAAPMGQLIKQMENNQSIQNQAAEWEQLLSVYKNVPEAIDIINQKIKELNDQLQPKSGDSFADFYQEYSQAVNEAGNLVSTIYDAQTQALYNQMDVLQEVMNLENQRWQEQSENMDDAGLQDTAYYQKIKKQHEKIIKDQTEQETKLKGDAWEAEQQSRLAGVIMNTAQGLAAAWTLTPPNPVLCGILTGIIAANGITQEAVISGQKNPFKRAFGGWIPGQGYGDSVPTLLTPGEFVVNRQAARENASALENINAGKGNGSGKNIYVNLNIDGNIIGNQDFVEQDLIPGIQKAINKGYSIN